MTRATGTLGPAVAAFAEGCLVIPEGQHEGEPFIFEPWQREVTDIIYETDERGLPMWKIAILGVPRGSGKSPLCAVYANHALADGRGSPQVFCTAAAKGQAGIVHKHANKEARNGSLEDFFEFPRVGEALGPIKCPSNGGVLKVLSADGDLQQGLVPYFVAEDEPHVFTTGKQVGLHFAMTTALHKREDSRMVMITTAGSNKMSLLGELIDAIIAQGEMELRNNGCLMIVRDYEAKRLLIWYGAPEDADVSDPAIWRACNPASWITDESLRVAAASNPESEFRRYYLNQWVLGADAVIQPAAWDACEEDGEIPAGAEIWVGVDLAEKRDHSGVMAVSPVDGGRLRPKGAVFDPGHENVRSLLPMVEAELRRLAETYVLRKVFYDEWQMRDLANRLASEGMPMYPFPQNDAHMVPACSALYDLITQQVIVHDGDKTLRTHILNAASVSTSRGGWRFAKPMGKGKRPDEKRKIDAAIALTLACAAYQSDNEPGSDPWVDAW